MVQSDTPWVLVTGASSGIGEAIAEAYARRGQPVILLARRADRLDALRARLTAYAPCEVLVADLAEPDAPSRIADTLAARGLSVGTLVNNAGYGVPGLYTASDWPTHARFLQVMVHAVCELTWRLLPQIRAHRGGVLNVASMAALMPGSAGQTLYAAAKSFLVKFTESLALENADAGVRATVLCPGFTYSEFHDVTGTRAKMRVSPGLWLQADAVARAGVEANLRGQVLVVPGWRYRLMHRLVRCLPHGWTMALMARNSRKLRPID